LYLKLTSADIKNASMITLSTAIAIFLAKWLSMSQLIWVMVIVALLPFSKFGRTAKIRHFSLVGTGIVSALAVAITVLLNSMSWLVITWLLIASFLTYCLPRYIPGSNATGIFILVFMIIAHSLPGSNLAAVWPCMEAILLGTFIVFFMNLLFDRDKTPLPAIPLDQSVYLIQRAVRIAVMIAVVFLVCHFFKIQNASWVALTVIVIDQNTLGASAKKASQRLLGTVFGVVGGILLGHFLFAPYPISRWSALLIVFLMFLFVRANYAICMFFGTVLLANIFYLLSGSSDIVHYMVSRLVDIFIGIIIGVTFQMLLFPRTLLVCLRESYIRFWGDIEMVISLTTADQRQQPLTKLDQDLKNIEQNLKDFRYEPISFLFKRYHLSVSLIPLIKSFLTALKSVQVLPQKVSDYSRQTIQVLLSYYKNPPLNSVISLDHSLLELSKLEEEFMFEAETKFFLLSLQKLVEHFRRIIQTPRWRLELK
jgi:uncharacterized membrane protein YccC